MLPNRPKSELFDDVPEVLEVRVTKYDWAIHTCRVRKALRGKETLKSELTNENLKMLSDQPAVGTPAEWQPEIDELNVKWMNNKHAVQINYFDGTNKKLKRMAVQRSASREDLQTKTTKAARALQEFHSQYNVGADDESDGSVAS